MTGFLASVATPEEAQIVLEIGADILDIKDPRSGALGAVAPGIAKKIVRTVNGRVKTSATIGDLPLDVDLIQKSITNTRASGVDIVKIGIFSSTVSDDLQRMLQQQSATGLKIVLVFFADMQPDIRVLSRLRGSGIYGVMLDTADKSRGSLRNCTNDDYLKQFIVNARDNGLINGLAGSLQFSDVGTLLELNPDFLGFRGALCKRFQRNNVIDRQAVSKIRAAIPATFSSDNLDQAISTSA